MRDAAVVLVVALVVGCGEEETDGAPLVDSTTQSGACGEVTQFDVTVRGRVEDQSGAPVPNATVTLEERNWRPGQIHGQVRTDASGQFELEGHGLPMVEDCWGTAVQFWLVGESGDLWGDKPMNAPIIESFEDGSQPVNLDFPLILR